MQLVGWGWKALVGAETWALPRERVLSLTFAQAGGGVVDN